MYDPLTKTSGKEKEAISSNNSSTCLKYSTFEELIG